MTRFAKDVKDNTGKGTLLSRDVIEGLDGMGVTEVQGAYNPSDAVKIFGKELRKLGAREHCYTEEIKELTSKLNSSEEKIKELEAKVRKIESSPLTYIYNYADVNNLEYKHAKSGLRVFRSKGLGGRWNTFSDIMEFREAVVNNPHLIKKCGMKSPSKI